MKYTLKINSLKLKTFIGINKFEKSNLKELLIDIKIESCLFRKGCVTDHINDTICYNTLCNEIQQSFYKKKYNLIENLTNDLFNFIEQYIRKISNSKFKLQIELIKLINKEYLSSSFTISKK